MGWPTVSEFTDYLIAAGLYGTTPTPQQEKLDLQGALDGAVDTWNDLTHYWPFLSTGQLEERRFDPPWPDTVLDLNGGIVSLSKLKIDVTYGNASPTTLVNLRDFWLRPASADARKKPWTSVILRRIYSTSEPASISVTGDWGYCNELTLPQAAKDGVMALAAQGLLPQITSFASKGMGLVRLTEGDSTKQWDFTKSNAGLQSVIDGALKQYVRLRAA